MSAILHGFSINTSGSPRRLAQRDTEAYWRRLLALGGTDINANDEVQNVQDFLAGVYDFAGRDAARVISPLRQSQNVGTGSAALNIVGPNITLVGGPTWGSSGVSTVQNSSFFWGAMTSFSGQNTILKCDIFTTPQPAAFPMSAIISGAVWSAGDFGNFAEINSNGASGTQWRYVSNGASSNLSASSPQVVVGSRAATTRVFLRNATETSASGLSAPSGTYSRFVCAGRSTGASSFEINAVGFTATHAAVVVLSVGLTSAGCQQLRTIYKSTLGQGLGLP
jgi:hypothetical protein